MFNYIVSALLLSTGLVSVPAQVGTTYGWLMILGALLQWHHFRGWYPGSVSVQIHPGQPRLPEMTNKPVEAREVAEWERPDKEISFIFERPEDGEDEYYQVYTLVCRSERLRKSFRRLFRSGGADRYVFWNMGASHSHQIFHYGEGHQLPERVDPNARLICCHPELLPPHLRKQHLFPDGFGPVRVEYGSMTHTEEGYFLARFYCRVK